MRNGFDINRIKGDGYLVIPLSMSRLSNSQSPEETYEIFQFFAKKLETFSNDMVLLYTGGLYFNDEAVTYEKRIKLNAQMSDHVLKLRKLIETRKEFMPGAFHFLPIDYVILNSKEFRPFFKTLKDLVKIDEDFKACVKQDMGEREYNEARENFILEELVVSHIIKERMVEFPRTLVKNDTWRMIIYPGNYLKSDEYQYDRKILTQNKGVNPFSGTRYDFDMKKLVVYGERMKAG